MSEETKQLSEAEHLIAMKNSQGWGILEARYNEIVQDMSDLRTIPKDIYNDNGQKIREATSEERMNEMIVREGALSLFEELFGGITADIDTFHDTMKHDMKPEETDNIKRFDT